MSPKRLTHRLGVGGEIIGAWGRASSVLLLARWVPMPSRAAPLRGPARLCLGHHLRISCGILLLCAQCEQLVGRRCRGAREDTHDGATRVLRRSACFDARVEGSDQKVYALLLARQLVSCCWASSRKHTKLEKFFDRCW